jgi:hypothetical protein
LVLHRIEEDTAQVAKKRPGIRVPRLLPAFQSNAIQ